MYIAMLEAKTVWCERKKSVIFYEDTSEVKNYLNEKFLIFFTVKMRKINGVWCSFMKTGEKWENSVVWKCFNLFFIWKFYAFNFEFSLEIFLNIFFLNK